MTDRTPAQREADRLRARGTRIPQLDDWRCYRCGAFRAATAPSTTATINSPMGTMQVRVCSPSCPR